MRPPVLNPLFAVAHQPARRRAEAGEALCAPARPRRAAGGRPAVPPALGRDRPPGAAEAATRLQPGQVVTVAVTVEEHRPPPRNRPRAPYRIVTSDDTGTLTLTFFKARPDYLEKTPARGRACATSPAPPNSTTACCRWCIPTAWSTRRASPTCRWSSRSIRSPKAWRSAMCGAPWTARSSASRRCRNGRTRPGCRASAFPALPTPCAICTGRRRRMTCCPKARPGRGSPMTNCSPASSRWRWCARICAARPAAAPQARASLRARVLKALPYALTHSQQKAVDDIIADLAQPQRMLRLLQGDVGSGKTVVALMRGGDRDRGRAAGRVDGADRDPRPPASEDHRAAGRSRRHPRRRAHRPRARRRAQEHPRPASRSAISTSWSAPMRCSRRTSPSTISRSPSSTSSTASACISGWRWRRRARRSTCWC